MTIRDEMAKVICKTWSGESCAPDLAPKVAQAILDIPQIQALVDALRFYGSEKKSTNDLYFDGGNKAREALAPFTEVRGK